MVLGAPATVPPVGGPTFRVPELTEAARAVVRATFPDEVWVEGEIASIKRTAAGHVFIDLIEPAEGGGPPAAVLPVVLWSGVRREVNEHLRAHGAVRMTEGVRIRVRGQVDLYARSGRLQLRMTAIDPDFTVGQLAAERSRILRVLADEGLLDRNAGRPLPELPRRVGLVTRVGSAAHADALDELRAAGFGLEVLEVDTAVQGSGAERGIVRALRAVERAGADVVLVVRGGGARTDLVAFDAESVARAVADLTVPVLTGVGHEVDDTVIDAVAHTACKTPTACAAALVDHVGRAVARLDHVAARLASATGALLDGAEVRARRHAERVVMAADGRLTRQDDRLVHRAATVARSADRQLAAAIRRIDDRAGTVARRAPALLAAAESRLVLAEARLASSDPVRMLDRGWSITRTSDGRLVRGPEEVEVGDELITTLAGGELASAVTESGEGS